MDVFLRPITITSPTPNTRQAPSLTTLNDNTNTYMQKMNYRNQLVRKSLPSRAGGEVPCRCVGANLWRRLVPFYSLALTRLHQRGMNSVFQMAQRQSFSTGRHPVRVPVPPSPHTHITSPISSASSFSFSSATKSKTLPARSKVQKFKADLPINFLATSFCPLQLYGAICNQHCC